MFNLKELSKNIDDFDTEKVCAIVVAEKYLSKNIEVVRFCMENLAKRRENGDTFDFESYIEEEFNKLPEFKQSTSSIEGMLDGFRNVL